MKDRTAISANHCFTIFRSALITILIAFHMPAHGADQSEVFDHFTTGFPLIGKHVFLDCSRCHVGGQFKGTPLACYLCHNGSRAPGKHLQHVPSSNICNDCHTEYSWTGAVYDHSDVMEPCQNCHNGSIAIGKPPGHIASTDTCDDCHNTISFSHVFRVDHASVIGTCDSCHNGIIATGKPADHIVTNDQCNECHNTITWSVTTTEP